MAQDTDEGIAYLRALKRPENSHAATAAAPALETRTDTRPSVGAAAGEAGNPKERFQGSEKRRSPRYHCEGSVQIQEDGRDVHTWATFTDISLHGCYVEAQATYPVGTALHLKLEANGVRVECKAASVRVSYPHLGMGISFLDMSEENRKGLKDLLATIARPSVIMGPGFIATLPETASSEASHAVPDPAAAIRALFVFFENRHMLTRDDFLATLAKSQAAAHASPSPKH
jgi:hypothetical protein